MEPEQLAILCVAAFATSVLSAVVGMAGGIVLLSVMLLFWDPLLAIPLHGAIQLVSNGTRTVVQRRYVRWDILVRYGALLVPAGVLGLFVAQALPPALARFLIGVFVLAATWAPGRLLLGTHPEEIDPNRRFLLLGGVVGAVNMTVGATGPLIAPFFLNLGLTCQALGHVVKIVIFGLAGFAFAEYLLALALLGGMVVVGTWCGSRILDRVSELWFTRLYKGVLTIIALRLVVGEGLDLVAG